MSRNTGADYVLVSLYIRGVEGTMTRETELEQVREQIQLLPHEALKGVHSAIGKAYKCLDRMSFDFPVRGVRALPASLASEAALELQKAKAEIEAQIEQLLQRYDTYVEESKKVLGQRLILRGGEPYQYPTADEIRKRFQFRYSVFQVSNAPVVIPGGQDVQEMLNGFREEALQSLVSGFATEVEAMTTRLREGGRVHASSMEQFEAFLRRFEDLAAVVSTPTTAGSLMEVRNLVRTTRQLMSGVTVDVVRENRDVRARVRAALSGVSGQMTQILQAPRGFGRALSC